MTGRTRRGGRGASSRNLIAVVLLAALFALLIPRLIGTGHAAAADAGTPAPVSTGTAPGAPDAPPASGAPGSALALLATLPVKGFAPATGYSRAQFGAAWLDMDHNGCDTRDDVLRRDLRATTGTGCRVLSGALTDPYTGRIIDFVRGNTTSTAVQIDHVVALRDAWRTGAAALSQVRREQLANDPVELLAVDGPTNEAKGDGDAATWLPPSKRFRCTYVAHQVAVKAAYGLWVTPAESAAIRRVLSACPSQAAPAARFAR